MSQAKVAVVTGVSRKRGIGRQIAARLLQEGYRVIGCDVHSLEDDGVEARGAATSPPPSEDSDAWAGLSHLEWERFSLEHVDVSCPEQVKALARRLSAAALAQQQQVISPSTSAASASSTAAAADGTSGAAAADGGASGTQGWLHLLVNNAGIVDPYMPAEWPASTSAATSSPDDPLSASYDRLVGQWRRFIDVNLSGAFYMSAALQPHMVPGDSAIVHISSTRALMSEPFTEGYSASKAGLLGLTHSQAQSWGPATRVNAVLPGWIDTSDDAGASITQEQHAWHPASGRVGGTDAVAQAVLFLADKRRSGFMSGQKIVVDGGVVTKMVYPE